MIEKVVTFKAKFKARIRIAESEEEAAENEDLYLDEDDAINNIDIPENQQSFYVENSFKVIEVKNLNPDTD